MDYNQQWTCMFQSENKQQTSVYYSQWFIEQSVQLSIRLSGSQRTNLLWQHQWIHCLRSEKLFRKHVYSSRCYYRFFLFNKRYSVGSQGSPLKQSITYADVLELDAEQNSFSFHVAALSYLAPEMNQLLYKLEGFDAEWYPVGRTGVINYSNLPYGDYLFRLKGSNSDGKWNEAGRVLKIRINPPFTCLPGHTLSMWR